MGIMKAKSTANATGTTEKTPKASKGKKKAVVVVPEMHTHNCLGGKHLWEHSNDEPCTRMSTKLCPTHAQAMRDQLNLPQRQGQTIGEVLGLKPETPLTPEEQAAYQQSLKGSSPTADPFDAVLDAEAEAPVAVVEPAPKPTPLGPAQKAPAKAAKAERAALLRTPGKKNLPADVTTTVAARAAKAADQALTAAQAATTGVTITVKVVACKRYIGEHIGLLDVTTPEGRYQRRVCVHQPSEAAAQAAAEAARQAHLAAGTLPERFDRQRPMFMSKHGVAV